MGDVKVSSILCMVFDYVDIPFNIATRRRTPRHPAPDPQSLPVSLLRKTLITTLPMPVTLPRQHLFQHSDLFLYARFTLQGHES